MGNPTHDSTPSPRLHSATRRRRRWLIAALVVAVLAIVCVVNLLRDPRPHFTERRSTLARVEPGPSVVEGEFLLQPVRLHASSGLAVDVTVKRALADSGKILPAVLILGGHRTGREAVRLVGPTPGTVVAGMSYPYAGDPRPEVITFLRDIPKIRRAFLDTPPAAMIALDYVLALPEVDTTQVEAIGVSLGAPFVIITGALDRRITRVWAMHGSGGSYAPLETSMRRTIKIPPLRWLAAAISNVLISGPRMAPEQWVGQIAPRQYVQINAQNDERLPRRSIERMFEAARTPKEMIWVSGAHIKSDTAVVRPLVRMVLKRVDPAPPATPAESR